MITNGKPEKDKRVAANSPKGAKSTAQKAKAARASASGTKEIRLYKEQGIKEGLGIKDIKINRGAKVLAKANKVISSRDNAGPLGIKNVVKVKKVDSDAYNVLSKRAKAAGLKGAEAEAAINKAFKTVSTRMTNDRQRTASRGEAIVRRESKKRSNKNLG
jgi:BRCT domain type II-containing protein